MKRLRLAEFIEVLVPTRDRHRRAQLAKAARVERAPGSLPAGDPEGHVVREKVHVMRTSCTRAQVDAFRKEGEALLAEMGRALNQEAVAYETREGLTILSL